MSKLLRRLLLNSAYCYYPRNIEGADITNYQRSKEFLRLRKVQIDFDQKRENYSCFLSHIRDKLTHRKITDRTLLTSGDRCYSVDLTIQSNSEKIVVLNICISILVPFYALFVVESYQPDWENLMPSQKKTPQVYTDFSRYNLDEEVNEIKTLLEFEFNYRHFPEAMLDEIVPEVSYDTISLGEFIFFNAFFLNHQLNRV